MSAPAFSVNHDLKEEIDGLTATEIELLRQEALHNLYFFCEGILGYDQLRSEVHADLCAFLMYDKSRRRMVLMPRGHLKSTICTMGRSIQVACKDINHTRICIQNAEVKKAEAFLWEIQQHWEKGVVLRKLFPELIPDKFQGAGSDWSSNTASLKRDAIFKESTWTCIGAGGSGASQHFNLIIPDDIVGDRQKASPAEMQAVKTWNESQEALLDNENDEICWVGTRKTMDDVYADIQEKWAGELAIFVREPIEDGKPIFPLKYSMQRLLRIMKNTPEVWAHDYMNNPIGKGGTDWGEYGIRDFWWGNDGYSVVFRDPQGTLKHWSFSDLDIVETVDSNSGEPLAPDKAAVVVHGTSPDHEIFILSSRSGRPSPDGLVDWVWADAVQWRPRAIGFEKAGQQTTKFYFLKRCMDEGTSFHVVDLSHKNIEKPTRIRGKLDTPIKEQRFYTHPTQFNLRFQIQRHPQLSLHNWDEIDCAAYGPDLYQPGMRTEDLEKQEEVQKKLILLRGRTGYGRSFRRV